MTKYLVKRFLLMLPTLFGVALVTFLLIRVIPGDVVDAAMQRDPQSFMWQPLIMGVDVARYGDDQSVIAFRRGRDACSVPWQKYRNISTMTLAAEIARLADQEKVDAIFVAEDRHRADP